MAHMGSTERRIACLKIAAAMNKRMTKEDPVVEAEELMLYASKPEQYSWSGEFTNKEHADAYREALEQMVAAIRAEKGK